VAFGAAEDDWVRREAFEILQRGAVIIFVVFLREIDLNQRIVPNPRVALDCEGVQR